MTTKLYGHSIDTDGVFHRVYSIHANVFDALVWAKVEQLTLAHIFDDKANEIVVYDEGTVVRKEPGQCEVSGTPSLLCGSSCSS